MKKVKYLIVMAFALLSFQILSASDDSEVGKMLFCSLGDDDAIKIIAEVHDVNLAKRIRKALSSRIAPDAKQKRVLVEPGPLIISVNAKGDVIDAILIGLDGWISRYNISQKDGKWTINERVKDGVERILDPMIHKEIQPIIALWRMSVE